MVQGLVKVVIGGGALLCVVWKLSNVVSKKKGQQREANEKGVVLVKLGGSAVTVKDKFETVNDSTLPGCLDQLSTVWKAGQNNLLVLHGAGSFGHFQAKKYGISKGNAHEEWRLGFADTRRSVTCLNHLVVTELVKRGVPAVGVSLFPVTTTHGKANITSLGALNQVKDILAAGMVPVIHGDAVLDTLQGCSIVSGDTILEDLATQLRSRLRAAVFLTDVAGVYDRPPSQEGATLLESIQVQPDGSFVLPEVDVASHDVTGGIATKIEAAAAVASIGVPVDIVQVASASSMEAMEVGSPFSSQYVGTRVAQS